MLSKSLLNVVSMLMIGAEDRTQKYLVYRALRSEGFTTNDI